MQLLRRSLMAAALFACASAAPAFAQVLPYPQDNVDAEQRQYLAELLRNANNTINDWSAAWQRGDSRATARFYTDDATLILPGRDKVQGMREIEKALQEQFGAMKDLRVSLEDAESSDRQVYILGRFMYEGAEGTVSGLYLAVLQGRASRWKIRSQMFRPDPPATQTADQ